MKQLVIRKRGTYGTQRLVVADVPKKSTIRLTIDHDGQDEGSEWTFYLTEDQAARLRDWLSERLTNW